MSILKIIKQCWRGCGDLPHVGEHPGTSILWMFIGIGAFAGSNRGIYGALIGAVGMALGLGWIYLWGAYYRAEFSDKLEKEKT